jgi:ABC-2 type transport system ATP-binding protein
VNRALLSTAALIALGPVLLRLSPTPPPRTPLASVASAPLGILAGVALFAVLARARPRVLVTPLALATALVVACAGMSEEALWRAFAIGRIAPTVGMWTAVALTTAAFAATHVPMLRARGATVQLVTGGAFGALFAATGSLVACAVAHATYNLVAVLSRSGSVRPASAIAFRRAEKRFGEKVALAPLDLTVERGQLVALLGPNGAGKTTLVSLVTGVRRPSHGDVRLFGRDPRDWRARRRLGTTPQQMDFPPTLRGREILDLARAHAAAPPALAELAGRFDLSDVLHVQNGSLSGGQRRRLALALAFANAPELVVLDEPTTGFDIESRRGAWGAIADFAATGGTVLLTTHYLEEADALADRVIVLAHGEVVADGSPQSLKSCAGDDLEQAFLGLTRAAAS